MTRVVRYSPKAQADLDNIWYHSLREWGAPQADAYIRSLHAAIQLVVEFPGAARDVRHIRPGLVKYQVGSHFLFMRIRSQSIDVVRILHQRMDHSRHL